MTVYISDGSTTISVKLIDLTKTVRRKAEKYELPDSQIYLPIGRIWYYELSFTVYSEDDFNDLQTILSNVTSGMSKIKVWRDASSPINELPTTSTDYNLDQCVIRSIPGAPNVRDVKMTIYE